MKAFFTRRRIFSISGIIFLLILWKIIALRAGSEQIMPSPEMVVKGCIRVAGEPGFLAAVSSTIVRGLIGFVLSLLLAAIIGFTAGIKKDFFHFINPLLVTLRSTPVISLILLAIIWLGSEMVPVFIAMLTMFPIICLNLIEGIWQVDPELIQMGQSYKIRKLRIITGIYLPSVIPFLLSGISNALGFGWRAIIIGEVLSQPRFGIGSKMQEARSFLLVSEVITWTLVAILISYIFEIAVRAIEKKLLEWK